jgi:hypothetical protein
MTWNPLDEPVDYIVLAGKKSPGLADVVGANAPRRWDERKGYGLSGAVLIYRGLALSQFSVRIRLYTTADWDAWSTWKALVDKAPLGTRAKAMDITHPFLEALGIVSVVVDDVLQPEQTGDGEWTIEIKFREYRGHTFTLSKPEGSTATPADPVEAEIGRLTDQFQRLAAQ